MLEQGVKFISPCFSVSVVNFKHVIAGYGTAFDLSKRRAIFLSRSPSVLYTSS